MKYKTKRQRLVAIFDAYRKKMDKASVTVDEVSTWALANKLYPTPTRSDPAEVGEAWERLLELAACRRCPMTVANDAKPVRLQRSRCKGSKLESPNGLPVVCVTRPGLWGNPYEDAKEFQVMLLASRGDRYAFGEKKRRIVWMLENLEQLRGKNLACWCKPGEPCHADVLLKLANE